MKTIHYNIFLYKSKSNNIVFFVNSKPGIERKKNKLKQFQGASKVRTIHSFLLSPGCRKY